MQDMKICSKCGILKDKSNYFKNKRIRSGLSSSCKDCYNQYVRDNKQLVYKKNRKWQKANKEHMNQIASEWRDKNYKEFRKQTNENQRLRLKNDPIYKLRYYLRNRLRHAVKQEFKKGSAIKDLGCSIQKLKEHLESMFKPGMTWKNYGKWHIDHIIPLSVVNLNNKEEFLKVNNYKNLQPLWAVDNMKKGNKNVR